MYEEKVHLLDRGEELTLAKALQVSQQHELSRTQVHIVHDEDTSVAAVQHKQARPKPQSNPAPQLPSCRRSTPNRPQHKDSCHRCGKDPNHAWNHSECPAMDPPALTARNRIIGLQLATDVPAYIRLKLSWMMLVLIQPST